MPQDKNGKDVKEGDVVSIKAKVQRVDGDHLHTIALDGHEGKHRSSITLDSSSVEFISAGAAPSAAVEPPTPSTANSG